MSIQLKVVIIDDGVNEKLYNTGSLWLNLEVTRDLQILQREDCSLYEPSHGTICGAIIKKYSPYARLGSIKVLNDTGRGVRDQLVKALYWCGDNKIKLVNLSLGTINFWDYEEVRKAVNYAAHKGVIIVAACNNGNVFTQPASLSNVIGVKCDVEGKLQEGQYRYNYYSLDGIDITACASHSLVKYDGSEKTTTPCNSFAAPMITAIVYNILKNNPNMSFHEIKRKLAEGAENDLSANWHANMYPRADWIENAIIFNTNCSKKQNVNIPYKGIVKRVVDIECCKSGEVFERVFEYLKKSKDILDGIDTVIANLPPSTCTLKGTNLNDLVDFLGSMDMNLVCLGDTNLYQNIYYNDNSERIKIFHPSVYTKVTSGEKAYIDMPVIAIYDFSSIVFLNCIGKLKDIFCERGYNAIAVSDSCRGIAYGIEYLPSMGNVQGEESEYISLEHLSRIYDPDIIILGIDALNRETDYFKWLENRYEIDIKICILSGQNQNTYDIIDISTESKNILIIAGDEHESTGEKIINITNEFYIETLYQYIVELFDENNKLNCE
ncbi:S8 family serine peptidase [Ruminiclostridium herbifermentans]|uniref:S8 family serine peptidase n=1 Tax=Ruminiclostridium herbifermentans TaxID=2488810 RepID=A0A4U7JAY7_9FIRM|nr:S8 family serine peptidase [Ruminiclostridium herbifermentans]QNU67845.1 S8 family serine peptidase [Ruminiclostridium herbifermentans]